MGILALVVVSGIAIGEAWVIWNLMNRILILAKVPPMEVSAPKKDERPEREKPKPIATIPFMN